VEEQIRFGGKGTLSQAIMSNKVLASSESVHPELRTSQTSVFHGVIVRRTPPGRANRSALSAAHPVLRNAINSWLRHRGLIGEIAIIIALTWAHPHWFCTSSCLQ